MRTLALHPRSHAPLVTASGEVSRAALRRWLGGRWILYFSHPDDFARRDFEADRWHVLLEESFAAAGVRPVGPPVPSIPGIRLSPSWIEDVGGARFAVPPAPGGHGRYVAAFDASLRLRRVFGYADARSAPSPLDLAVLTAQQRREVDGATRSRAFRGAAAVALVTVASALVLARRPAFRASALDG